MKKGKVIGLLLIGAAVVMTIWTGASRLGTAADDIDENGVVTIEDGTSTIDDTYAQNEDITGVIVPASVTSIGDGAFSSTPSLSSVSFASGSGLTTVGANAFSNTPALSSITTAGSEGLPDSVSRIGANAFYATGLSSFKIPSGLSSLDPSAFDDSGIAAFSGGSSSYTVGSDGNLYNSNGSQLLIVAPGKSGSVSIADGTTTIGPNAFRGNNKISSVTLPDSLTTISQNAFSGTGITDITIPASVTRIDSQDVWNVSTIRGHGAASEAARFANSINATFVNLDGSDDPDPDSYTVTFDPAGGTLTSASSVTVSAGQTAAKPTDPTRDGYTFNGWFNNADGAANPFDFDGTPITGNITLTAHWTANAAPTPNPDGKTFTVSFDLAGGTDPAGTIKSESVASGGYASHPGYPTRDGYTFIGWFDDASGATSAFDFANTKINGNLTLTAHWADSGSAAGPTQNSDGSYNMPDQTRLANDGTIFQVNVKVGKTAAPTGLDSTPKTAGPIDARYFLCLAIFLLGIAVMLLSRSRKFSYVSRTRKRREH